MSWRSRRSPLRLHPASYCMRIVQCIVVAPWMRRCPPPSTHRPCSSLPSEIPPRPPEHLEISQPCGKDRPPIRISLNSLNGSPNRIHPYASRMGESGCNRGCSFRHRIPSGLLLQSIALWGLTGSSSPQLCIEDASRKEGRNPHCISHWMGGTEPC